MRTGRRLLAAGLLLLAAAPAPAAAPSVVAHLGETPLGEPLTIYEAVAFSPDGNAIAAVTTHGTVRVWDPASGKVLFRSDEELLRPTDRALNDRGGPKTLAAFSAEAKALVAGLNQGPFVVWDVAAGKELRRLDDSRGVFFAMAASADGATLAALTADRDLLLWDVATGTRLRKWSIPQGERLTFSPDGKTLASGGADKVVRLWDVETGKEVKTLKGGHAGVVDCLAYSPDGKTLAASDLESGIVLWDPAEGKPLLSWAVSPKEKPLTRYRVFSLAFSPDGKTLVCGGRSRRSLLDFWDPSTGKLLRRIEGCLGTDCCTFSRDGKSVAAGGVGRVNVWDAATGRPTRGGHAGGINDLAFPPDGKTVTTLSQNFETKVWDATSGKELHTSDLGFYPRWLSGDGAVVAGVSSDEVVRVLGTADGKVRFSPDPRFPFPYPLSLSPDGALMVCRDDASLTLWELPAGRVRCKLGVGRRESYGRVAFSSDGALTSAAYQQLPVSPDAAPEERPTPPHDPPPPTYTLGVWDAETGAEMRSILLPHDAYTVAFSPDGRLLATGDPSPTRGFDLYETATGKVRLHVPGSFWPIAWSPDGRAVAVGVLDEKRDSRTLHLFDVYTGEDLCSFRDYTGGVTALAFSPEGNRLAVARDDSTADIWDLSGVLEGKVRPAELTANERDDLWAKLCGEDATAAHRAIGKLSRDKDAPAFLRGRVVESPEKGRIVTLERLEMLIAAIDDENLQMREKAARELTDLGPGITPTLRRRLKEGLPLEAEARVRQVLQAIAKNAKDAPAVPVAWLRATEALERLGTPEARVALEKLADGAGPGPEAARASLARLKRCPAQAP
jgi:WD40 repeat protein